MQRAESHHREKCYTCTKRNARGCAIGINNITVSLHNLVRLSVAHVGISAERLPWSFINIVGLKKWKWRLVMISRNYRVIRLSSSQKLECWFRYWIMKLRREVTHKGSVEQGHDDGLMSTKYLVRFHGHSNLQKFIIHWCCSILVFWRTSTFTIKHEDV